MNFKFLIFCLLPTLLYSQDKPLNFSGFIDTYLGFDANRPINNNRASFLYNHTRHSEVSLNLAFLKASYQTETIRANLAFGTGTYMQYNYAAEPNILQNIFEANVGVKLDKNTWIDVGILPSHIGFESAISKDCWTLSRSLAAENSPYFETGIKLSNTPSDKLTLAVLYLNGWQRISRVNGNSTPAFGTQVTYKFNDQNLINWSTFIGNDKPDSSRRMRYFNNFYTVLQPTEKIGITFGVDFGAEQKSMKSTKYNLWWTPVLIFRKVLNDKLKLAFRSEYFFDKNGVIISSEKPNVNLFGLSVNADYEIVSNVLWRFELKRLSSNQAIFPARLMNKESSLSVLTSIAISF